MDIFKKIWYDPVWSKVIASVIFIMGTTIYTINNIIVIVFIAVIVIMVLWVIYLYRKHNHLFYFDREDILFDFHYTYTLNPDKKTLDLTANTKRKIKCLSRIDYVLVHFSVRDTFLDTHLDNQSIKINAYEVTKNGKTIENTKYNVKVYKDIGDDIEFRIEFNPPLQKNEIVKFEYSYKLSKFKYATREYLLENIRRANDIRDYEFNSFEIKYPTQLFNYTIEFDKNTGITFNKFNELDVLRITVPFDKEKKHINKHSCISHSRDTANYMVKLERKDPPLRANYKLKWNPPSEASLNK